MKSLSFWIVLFAVVGVGGYFAYEPIQNYLKERNRLQWKTAKVQRGTIIFSINSTGTVKPVLSVAIGSFVSGPIADLNVDFNDSVKQGQILAKIDPRLFQSNVARDEAVLASRKAELERVETQLQLAILNKGRGEALRRERMDTLSQAEMDTLTFEVKSLEAQVKLARASILQAQATLENSAANLEYTNIKSPVDGTIIDRKVEPGQTIAAQFQTPELFTVAPDLRKKIHIFASVDESDIGWIQRAKDEKRPVTFTVDAHPNELFHGTIEQIRVSSTTVQNVVTYPVVIAAPNPELRLLPGMTASISFEIDRRETTLKIPSAALRFFPTPEQVRKEDRHLVDGTGNPFAGVAENKLLSADEQVQAQRLRNRRHVWRAQGNLLEAIEIETGLDENRFAELVEGMLEEGDELVTGIQPKL